MTSTNESADKTSNTPEKIVAHCWEQQHLRVSTGACVSCIAAALAASEQRFEGCTRYGCLYDSKVRPLEIVNDQLNLKLQASEQRVRELEQSHALTVADLARSTVDQNNIFAQLRASERALERVRELWRMYRATIPGLNARDSFGQCVCCGQKPYQVHSEHCYLANMDAALASPGSPQET